MTRRACDHEYVGQPGCVCDPNPEIERLRSRITELERSDTSGQNKSNMTTSE